MGSSARQIGADYREQVTLPDGTAVNLRAVRPDDKELFVRGFARMSEQSRFLRFFSSKSKLTSTELSYLTELDGERHFAIGALSVAEDGNEDGLGVGRFVCYEQEPTVAEPAVAVIDDMQGKGLGKLLLARLVAAAAERGVLRFRCHVLSENTAAMALIHKLAPQAEEHCEDSECVIEFALDASDPEQPVATERSALEHALALAAQGALVLKRRFATLHHPPKSSG